MCILKLFVSSVCFIYEQLLLGWICAHYYHQSTSIKCSVALQKSALPLKSRLVAWILWRTIEFCIEISAFRSFCKTPINVVRQPTKRYRYTAPVTDLTDSKSHISFHALTHLPSSSTNSTWLTPSLFAKSKLILSLWKSTGFQAMLCSLSVLDWEHERLSETSGFTVLEWWYR